MTLTDRSLRGFLQVLASRRPTPGGGSAAALSAALGVSLYVMVSRIIMAREQPAARRRQLRIWAAACEQDRRALLRLVEQDARAYGRLVAAGTPPGVREGDRPSRCQEDRWEGPWAPSQARGVRRATAAGLAARRLGRSWRGARRLEVAQRQVMRVPLAICDRAMAALRRAPALTPPAGRALASDVVAGSALLIGGFVAAAAMVAANLDGMGQSAQAAAVRRQLQALLRQIPGLVAQRGRRGDGR